MRKIILPLIAMVVLTGCSSAMQNDTEKALACNQLYESRVLMNATRYDLESYEAGMDAVSDSQIWYDSKFGGCVFAVRVESSYWEFTPEKNLITYYRKEYWDLENDSKIWSFTTEFDENAVDDENNFFSDNKF